MAFAEAGAATTTTKVVGKKDEWTAMFELLKEYKKEFQHVCPLQRLEYRGKKLGKWVAAQRSTQQRRLRQGLESNGLAQERTQQLNGICFVWDMEKTRKHCHAVGTTIEQTNNHINAPASKSIAPTAASRHCNNEGPSSAASDRCSLDDEESDIINDSETECSSSVSAQASISAEHDEKLQSCSDNDNSSNSSLADCSWNETTEITTASLTTCAKKRRFISAALHDADYDENEQVLLFGRSSQSHK
jgi:hypothetical protein